MERPLVAKRVLEWLVPGGWVAVAAGMSVWNGTADWQAIVRTVIRKWLGEERRAGGGTFRKPDQRHEEVLAEAGFEQVKEADFEVPYVWTLNSLVGLLYSTSFASKAVLGEMTDEFEANLRQELLAHDPAGEYAEILSFQCIMARAPTVIMASFET